MFPTGSSLLDYTSHTSSPRIEPFLYLKIPASLSLDMSFFFEVQSRGHEVFVAEAQRRLHFDGILIRSASGRVFVTQVCWRPLSFELLHSHLCLSAHPGTYSAFQGPGAFVRAHKAVVSNASVWDTQRLLPPGAVPEQERKEALATPQVTLETRSEEPSPNLM